MKPALLTDVYINSRDRKPPVLDLATRGRGKIFGRPGCDVLARSRARSASKDSSPHQGNGDQLLVAVIASARACSCEQSPSRQRIPRYATSAQGDRDDTSDSSSQHRLVSVVIGIRPPPDFDSAVIG